MSLSGKKSELPNMQHNLLQIYLKVNPFLFSGAYFQTHLNGTVAFNQLKMSLNIYYFTSSMIASADIYYKMFNQRLNLELKLINQNTKLQLSKGIL